MKMNGKLKKIICVLAVIALTAVNLAVLNYALRDEYCYTRYQPFMDQNEDIDVVFIGSSRVVNSVNPMQLWHDYGITSYNFGNSAFGIENSYWSFRLSLRHHIPKVAVLDAFGASRPETDKLQLGLAHNGLDMYPLSLEHRLCRNRLSVRRADGDGARGSCVYTAVQRGLSELAV